VNKIIILEDDASTLMYTETIVKHSEFKGDTLSFLNGKECLDYIKSNPISSSTLILSDLNLFDMSAFDFIDTLLSSYTNSFKLILLSSSFRSETLQKASNYEQIVAVIEKPFSIIDLNRFLK